ncbi:MAG: hypothetical protein KBT66_14195 [Amphritea sp.]|nr:hypothetical protein [Amphritea sp.]
MIKYFGTVLLALALSACSNSSSVSEQLRHCEDPRPEVCPMSYIPACGYSADGLLKTYSNACVACSDSLVVGVTEEPCQSD